MSDVEAAAAPKLLAVDVISCVLDHLTQPDVLRVASISNHWRNAAKHHAHFYRHISFDNSSLLSTAAPLRQSNMDTLETLADLLQGHTDAVRATDIRLGVCIELSANGNIHPFVVTFLDAVRRSMKQICKLRLVVDGRTLAPRVLEALCNMPAPILRSLSIRSGQAIPQHLFQSCAPYLVDVAIMGTPFDPSPILAFSKVTSLDVGRILLPALAVCLRHFPNIRDLSCDVGEVGSARLPPLPQTWREDMLRLSHLRTLHFTATFYESAGVQAQELLDIIWRCSCAAVTVSLSLSGPPNATIAPPVMQALRSPLSVSFHHLGPTESSGSFQTFSYSPFDNLQCKVESLADGHSCTVRVAKLTVNWCLDGFSSLFDRVSELRVWHWYLRGATAKTGKFSAGSCTHVFAFLPMVESLHVDLSEEVTRWTPDQDWERELRLYAIAREEAASMIAQQPPAWPALKTVSINASDCPKAVARESLANYARLLRVPSILGSRPSLILSPAISLRDGGMQSEPTTKGFFDGLAYL